MMNKKEKLFKIFYILFFIVFSVVGMLTSIKTADNTLVILWSIALGMWICEFINVLMVPAKDSKWKKK